jgi:hypothetical protein
MRSVVASFALASALLASLPSSAQTEPARVEALKRYNEGIALHDSGSEQEAYLKFAQAYAVLKTPPILFNLARTEQLTLRLVDASAHFREYIGLPEQALTPKQTRDKARAFLVELRAQLGHLALTAPVGAAITIDGKEQSQRAPVVGEIDLMPALHVIVARLDDKSATATISVAAGVTTRANLEFEQPAAAPVPQPASPPIPQSTIVEATAPRNPAVVAHSDAMRDVVRWGSAGVAVIGVGVGIGFMLAANSKDDELNAYQVAHPHACTNGPNATCTAASSLQDDRDQNRTASTIGFIAGGIGVAAAAASWLLWPGGRERAPRSAWIAPSFGVAGYGLHAGGRF